MIKIVPFDYTTYCITHRVMFSIQDRIFHHAKTLSPLQTMRSTFAIILAGGQGKRLLPLTKWRAKPALPFGYTFRLIDPTLLNVTNSGIWHIGVLAQYKADPLTRYLHNSALWQSAKTPGRMTILAPKNDEQRNSYLGTADAVRKNLAALNKIDNRCDVVLLLAADHVYQMDYTRFIDYHRRRRADLSVATTNVPRDEAHHFGVPTIGSAQRITNWREKPHSPHSSCVSMGVYAFSREFLTHILRTTPAMDVGADLLPQAIRQDARIFSYPFEGYWRDVGTPASYWLAHMELLAPDLPAGKSMFAEMRSRIDVIKKPLPSTFGRSARIKRSLIAPGCTIEGTVINSVLSPGVFVGRNALVRDSILFENVRVGAGAALSKVIADEDVDIESGVSFTAGLNEEPVILEKKFHYRNEGASKPGAGR